MTPSTAIPTPYAIPPRPPPPSLPLRGVGPSGASLCRDVSRVIESPAGETTTWGFAERSSERGNGGGGVPETHRVRPTRLPPPRRSLKGASGFGEVGFSQRGVGWGVRAQQYQARELESKTPQAGNGFGTLAKQTVPLTGEVRIRAQRSSRNSQQGQPPQTPRRLWPFSPVGGAETFVDGEKDSFSSAAADRRSLAMRSPCESRTGAGRTTDTASHSNGNRRASASQADGVKPGEDSRSGSSWWGRAGTREAHAGALPPPPLPPYSEPYPIAPPPYSEALEELEERQRK